jgi:hypothetical protein
VILSVEVPHRILRQYRSISTYASATGFDEFCFLHKLEFEELIKAEFPAFLTSRSGGIAFPSHLSDYCPDILKDDYAIKLRIAIRLSNIIEPDLFVENLFGLRLTYWDDTPDFSNIWYEIDKAHSTTLKRGLARRNKYELYSLWFGEIRDAKLGVFSMGTDGSIRLKSGLKRLDERSLIAIGALIGMALADGAEIKLGLPHSYINFLLRIPPRHLLDDETKEALGKIREGLDRVIDRSHLMVFKRFIAKLINGVAEPDKTYWFEAEDQDFRTELNPLRILPRSHHEALAYLYGQVSRGMISFEVYELYVLRQLRRMMPSSLLLDFVEARKALLKEYDAAFYRFAEELRHEILIALILVSIEIPNRMLRRDEFSPIKKDIQDLCTKHTSDLQAILIRIDEFWALGGIHFPSRLSDFCPSVFDFNIDEFPRMVRMLLREAIVIEPLDSIGPLELSWDESVNFQQVVPSKPDRLRLGTTNESWARHVMNNQVSSILLGEKGASEEELKFVGKFLGLLMASQFQIRIDLPQGIWDYHFEGKIYSEIQDKLSWLEVVRSALGAVVPTKLMEDLGFRMSELFTVQYSEVRKTEVYYPNFFSFPLEIWQVPYRMFIKVEMANGQKIRMLFDSGSHLSYIV